MTAPQPGQTELFGTTSLVIPWSCATWFCKQARFALFVALYASCCALTPSWAALQQSIRALIFSTLWKSIPSPRSRLTSTFPSTSLI